MTIIPYRVAAALRGPDYTDHPAAGAWKALVIAPLRALTAEALGTDETWAEGAQCLTPETARLPERPFGGVVTLPAAQQFMTDNTDLALAIVRGHVHHHALTGYQAFILWTAGTPLADRARVHLEWLKVNGLILDPLPSS